MRRMRLWNEPSITIAQRLWQGFGTLLGLLVVLTGVVAWLLRQQDRDLDRIVASREPAVAAVRRMEVGLSAAGVAVLQYLEVPEASRRQQLTAAGSDLAQGQADYRALTSGPTERGLDAELERQVPPFLALTAQIMDGADELSRRSNALAVGFADCESVLAGNRGAPRAALSRLQLELAELGTWLGHYRTTGDPEHRARLDAAGWRVGGILSQLRRGEPALAPGLQLHCGGLLDAVQELVAAAEAQSTALQSFAKQRDGLARLLGEGLQSLAQANLTAAKAAADATARRVQWTLAVLALAGAAIAALTAIRASRGVLAVETLLEERSEWLRVTLESIADAVIATDVDGRITFLNDVAQNLTGWDAVAAEGRPLTTVLQVVDETTGQPVALLGILGRRDGLPAAPSTGPLLLVARNGSSRPIDERTAPIRADDGVVTGAVVVFRDVSERRAAESRLREADRRKDEFLATLAHELRNPLAPLRNALAILRQTPEAGERGAPLAIMGRQLDALVRLVDDLLDVSRISRGLIELRLQPFELRSLLAQAVETSRPLIDERRHHLDVVQPPAPVVFLGDSLRLAQALSNLLTNAAKHSEPGSHIQLVATLEPPGEGAGDVPWASIRVRDNGRGIPPELLPHIFELFVQGSGTREHALPGLGIGLALSRQLVVMHGGTLTATSDGPGHGSELTLRLPTATLPVPSPPTAEDVATAGRPVARRARRILAVDDNRDSADSLALLLRLMGHSVVTVYDGAAALTVAARETPEVVILDLGLPGLGGIELAARLRGDLGLRHAALIALTGWGQEEDRRRTRDAGFDRHLVKPVDPEELRRLLDELV
jgi:two-component system CheB/CheR fusion protein